MTKRKDDANPKDRLGVKKPPLSIVPMSAFIEEAFAFAEGAAKYGEFNWRNKPVKRRVYLEAILRHTIAALAGEDFDPDTFKATGRKISHEAKIRACCAIIIDARQIGNLIDDRFEKDNAGALLAAFTSGDYHAAAARLTRTPARTLGKIADEGLRAALRRRRKARRK
jgi:hypothetical protein